MNDRHPADDLLIARALDELEGHEGEEPSDLDTHLAACPRCREVVSTLAIAMRQFRASRRPEAPARILVDLMAEQAAVSEAGRATAPRRDRVYPAGDRRSRSPITFFAGLRSSLAPALAVAALLLVLFLTGFWAGRQTAQVPVGPVTPAGTAASPSTLVVETRTGDTPRPLPEPPRIPFQTVASEIR